MWGTEAPFLTDARELAAPSEVEAAPAPVLACDTATQAVAERARLVAHDHVNVPSWSITSATAEAHHIAQMTRAVEASADDPSKVVVANTPSHRADAGQAWGTLVHGLLEHAMRHANTAAADLRRLAMWLTVEEPKLRDVLDLAVETVLQVAKAGFWAEVKAASHAVEAPFAFMDDGKKRVVMNGVIDLMFERAGQWQVIDYKTDVKTQVKAEAYALQLGSYRRAIAAVGAAPGDASIRPVRGSGV